MKVSPLTKESVNYVIDHLGEISRRETEVLGVDAECLTEYLRQKFTGMIGEPFTLALSDDDGPCCALIALEPMGGYQFRTHFIGTDEAFRTLWFPMTRFFRSFTDHMVKKNGASIQIRSAYGEGKAFDWFNIMGFELQQKTESEAIYVKGRPKPLIFE